MQQTEDEFVQFCKKNPTYEEAVTLYGQRVYEAELEGTIRVENARVYFDS